MNLIFLKLKSELFSTKLKRKIRVTTHQISLMNQSKEFWVSQRRQSIARKYDLRGKRQIIWKNILDMKESKCFTCFTGSRLWKGNGYKSENKKQMEIIFDTSCYDNTLIVVTVFHRLENMFSDRITETKIRFNY